MSFSALRTFLLAAVLVLPFVAMGQASLTPVSLTCEYHDNPLGIQTTVPRLSWKFAATDAQARGEGQTAYEIQAAATPEALASGDELLWSTGKVESDASIQIPWAGKELTSRDRVFWHVRVWDEAGAESPWSGVAHFSVGLLQPGDWSAQWIGIDEEAPAAVPMDGEWIWAGAPETVSSPPAGTVYLRQTVLVEEGKELARVRLYASVDNRSSVYVNGERVGTANGFTSASEVVVGPEFFHPGKNVLAIEGINDGDSPNPAGVLANLELVYAGDSTMRYVTSADWRGATEPAEGWMLPDFDDSTWAPALVIGVNGAGPWERISIPTERRLPARYLRREFRTEQAITHATAYAVGVGYYEMYINGAKVGDRVLEPAVSDYRERVYYGTFDVTEMVREGRNAVGAIVGNGHFFAPRVADPITTLTFGLPRFICQLELEYEDGTVERIVSDESWKATNEGPIGANNIYDGEDYDATKDLGAWTEPAYYAGAWKDADVMETPGGVLSPQMIEPQRVTLTIKPAAVDQVSPGVYVFDMGQNMVGWMRIKVQGPAGTKVQLRHAETINKDGTLNVANLRSAKVTDTYVLKGEGVEEYAPRFTYHGFRFVEVRGWPGTPTRDDLVGEVVHTDMPYHGRFLCSNELINAIKRNLNWGVRGNVRSMPTDCPQRDERMGWLGDIATESKAQSYDFMNANFYRKWLGDIRDAQNEAGSIPDVAPPFWTLHNDNVTWPAAYVIVPGWYEHQYDDLRLIADHYPTLRKWVLYMAQFLEDGIMPRDTYGDWCVPPERPELIHSEDPARKTPGPVLGTAYYYHMLRLLEGFADDLGKKADAKEYAKMAETCRKAFVREFYNADDHTFANGTQTASLLALSFGLVPEGDEGAVAARLADKIMNEANGHIATGLVGGQWLMRTLCDYGYGDVAFTLATQEDYPSWGYMVRNGATTFWELWNGNTADPAMNSHNHLMLSGDFGLWLYEYLAGIRNAKGSEAFARIEIRPYVLGDLTWVEAETETLRGKISVRWDKTDDAFTLKVTIPPNTTAEVALPVLTFANPVVREAGTVVFGEGAVEAVGVSNARAEGDRIVVTCAPGSYVFTLSGS